MRLPSFRDLGDSDVRPELRIRVVHPQRPASGHIDEARCREFITDNLLEGSSGVQFDLISEIILSLHII
jgi:hypothetical protein